MVGVQTLTVSGKAGMTSKDKLVRKNGQSASSLPRSSSLAISCRLLAQRTSFEYSIDPIGYRQNLRRCGRLQVRGAGYKGSVPATQVVDRPLAALMALSRIVEARRPLYSKNDREPFSVRRIGVGARIPGDHPNHRWARGRIGRLVCRAASSSSLPSIAQYMPDQFTSPIPARQAALGCATRCCRGEMIDQAARAALSA